MIPLRGRAGLLVDPGASRQPGESEGGGASTRNRELLRPGPTVMGGQCGRWTVALSERRWRMGHGSPESDEGSTVLAILRRVLVACGGDSAYSLRVSYDGAPGARCCAPWRPVGLAPDRYRPPTSRV